MEGYRQIRQMEKLGEWGGWGWVFFTEINDWLEANQYIYENEKVLIQVCSF